MEQSEPRLYDDEINLRRYGQLLWHWAWLIVLCGLLAGVAAYVGSRLQTPIYQATTTLLVSQAPNAQTSDYNAVLTADRLASTYVRMLIARPVLEETLSRLDVATPIDEFEETIDASLLTSTQLIELKVEDPNAVLAAEIANTIAVVFGELNDARQAARYADSKTNLQAQVETLQADIEARQARLTRLGNPTSPNGQAEVEQLTTEITELRGSYTTLLKSYEDLRIAEAQGTSSLTQIAPATPPTEPVRPRTLLNTLLAAIVGGMLAVGAVLVIEYLNDTIKTPEEVTRNLGLPVIGTIVKLDGEEGVKPYVAQAPRSPAAEAFRSLRTNLQFAAVDGELRTLLVTSPDPEVGKSTVSANLAAIVAQGGKKVILLDIDLRRPRLHEVLGMTNSQGLSQLFKAPATRVKDVVRPTSVEGLSIVTTGELPPNPAELLGSVRMAAILKDLAQLADMIVVDSPPAGIVTDPVVIAPKVDGVILVIEPGRTKLPIALHAVEVLRQSGARMLGVVFNNVPSRRAGYYGAYRYQYAYESSGPDGHEDGKRHRLRLKGKKQSHSETAGD